MNIGQLRHKVEVQEKVTGQNDLGDPITYWNSLVTTWAAIEPLKGDERWQAAALMAETTHRVTMRFVAGISPRCRILFEGRMLEIESVINKDERNRWLELMCKEEV